MVMLQYIQIIGAPLLSQQFLQSPFGDPKTFRASLYTWAFVILNRPNAKYAPVATNNNLKSRSVSKFLYTCCISALPASVFVYGQWGELYIQSLAFPNKSLYLQYQMPRGCGHWAWLFKRGSSLSKG